MFEHLILQHCSPTLAGIKTGSMFSCSYKDKHELKSYLSKYNRMLSKKGIRVLPLRVSHQKALIYVYRPNQLQRDLSHSLAVSILFDRGYPCHSAHRCIAKLIRLFKSTDEFPHEIGLFLGYPPEDVYGFINKNRNECKETGFWKVYDNVERARQLFSKYRKCNYVYMKLWENGRSLEKLTVAT